MRILHIVSSAGDAYYCGNCLRDSFQAQALLDSGCDLTLMPIFLPSSLLRGKKSSELFFAAISYWLAREFFERAQIPKALEKILSSKFALSLAKPFFGSTTPKAARKMTLSMIEADDPHFKSEFEKIKSWIKSEGGFDLIQISSTLMSGLAKALRLEFKTPVVCSMQDEEAWLDKLSPADSARAWEGILKNAKYIEKFIAPSFYYKNKIQSRFPELKNIEVLYPCAPKAGAAQKKFPNAPTIGFLSGAKKSKGLELLADAFIKIKEQNSVENLRLSIAGGSGLKDKKFLNSILKKLSKFRDCVDFKPDYKPEMHGEFFENISLICVPADDEDALGLYVIEAFAHSKPAIEPDCGAFPEIMQNAGLKFKEGSADSLKSRIERAFSDSELFEKLCQNARQLSKTAYSPETCAKNLKRIYAETVREFSKNKQAFPNSKSG